MVEVLFNLLQSFTSDYCFLLLPDLETNYWNQRSSSSFSIIIVLNSISQMNYSLPTKSHSLAYSAGKQINKSTINPNLNIEDQYVENLLKQIQFLSLQTKLIRQKQSEQKGTGLMSLINKENRPVVDHLLASGEKYKEMKDDLSKKLNSMTIDSIELEAEERALLKKRDYNDRKRREAQIRNKENLRKSEQSIRMIYERIMQQKKKQEELQKENTRLLKANQFSEIETQKIVKDNLYSTINSQTEGRKKKVEYQLEVIDQGLKTAQIAKIKDEIKQLKTKMEEDPKYKQLLQQHQQLVLKYEQTERALSIMRFSLIQTQHTFKLAQLQRDKQIKQKRASQEELQAIETLYNEIVRANEAKIEKRKKSRLVESIDLKKAESLLTRLQKDLAEVKRRFEKADEISNKYTIQSKVSEAMLQKLQAKKAKLQQIHSKLTKQNATYQQQKESLDKYNSGVKNDTDRLRRQSTKLQEQLTRTQQIYTELQQKFTFLEGSMTLQEQIRNVRIDQLMNVIQKNADVNNTVMELMNKWKDIQTFGRS